jgi:hypothetical protein
MKLIYHFFFVLFICAFSSCTECEEPVTGCLYPGPCNQLSKIGADVAVDWVKMQRQLVQSTTGYTSPVAARAYAYAMLAMYESIVPGMDSNKSYSGLITDYTRQDVPSIEPGKLYIWELVVNACMATILKAQFKTAPTDKLELVNQLEYKYLDLHATIDPLVKERSVTYGKRVAEAIYNFSKADGQDEAYLNNYPAYVVPNTPGHWVSTIPNEPTPLQAYWGNVRPFLQSNVVDELIVKHKPILEYSLDAGSEFNKHALDLFNLNKNNFEAKWINQYWDDEDGTYATSTGRILLIASSVIKLEKITLDLACEVFSKIGICAHDAFVSCWKSKYHYNLLRPYTYLSDYLNLPFTTYSNTPSSPSFPAESAIVYGSTMEVLSSYFGYRYAGTYGDSERRDFSGMPRSFASFYDVMDEASYSKELMGHNFRQDNVVGKKQGLEIGNNIIGISLKK